MKENRRVGEWLNQVAPISYSLNLLTLHYSLPNDHWQIELERRLLHRDVIVGG
jgi:hypothetical protein